MKFTKIPTDSLTEMREVEIAVNHHNARYEVRTERNGVKFRAFAVHKPYAKVKDCNFFVWDLRNNCKA